jgi:hypothetical protein
MWGSRHTALLRGATATPPRRDPAHLRPAGMPIDSRIVCAPVPSRRRLLGMMLAVLPAAMLSGAVAAADIPVVSAALRIEEGEVVLSAEFDFRLTPALEQALDKGIPLYFTIDFELERRRFLWFPDKVVDWSITYRVSYSSLTRQYRLSSGPLGQTFESLADVERFVGHVASRTVARADDLSQGVRYDAAVRLKLDVNELPKPFQVNALASREWQLSSDWHHFAFTP